MRLGRSKLLGWWFLEVPIFLFYGNQLLGGNRAVLEGEVVQVVDSHKIDFEKIKAWCALQPNDSSEPKVPEYRDFHYRGDE